MFIVCLPKLKTEAEGIKITNYLIYTLLLKILLCAMDSHTDVQYLNMLAYLFQCSQNLRNNIPDTGAVLSTVYNNKIYYKCDWDSCNEHAQLGRSFTITREYGDKTLLKPTLICITACDHMQDGTCNASLPQINGNQISKKFQCSFYAGECLLLCCGDARV